MIILSEVIRQEIRLVIFAFLLLFRLLLDLFDAVIIYWEHRKKYVERERCI